ncbi:lipocalin family protein [Marinobacter caseinilyticus]|uniref:lipocalin family protein n=1 Tax=Marinobacter caseinilyticus TaxID=2692195 RepID=UPI00140A7F0E|nr:lipocalin family protein [Marinobacter caseinilyticus]
MKLLTSVIVVLLLTSCVRVPDGVQPVRGFEAEKYLGKWYEIARLDHSFEAGLSQVTAEYSRRDDGGLRVINRGYSEEDQAWSEAEGRAYFVDSSDVGYLKVSFFGPFYGAYVVFGLDQNGYEYAFVSGPDTSYLWLLARAPEVSETVMAEFLDRTRTLGFDTDALIYVDHKKQSAGGKTTP